MGDAKSLVERLRTDKGLRDQIHEITTIEERLKFIETLGYECDGDAIKDAWDNFG